MRTEPRSSARQWLWFLLIWAAGVTLFGAAAFVLRTLMKGMAG